MRVLCKNNNRTVFGSREAKLNITQTLRVDIWKIKYTQEVTQNIGISNHGNVPVLIHLN